MPNKNLIIERLAEYQSSHTICFLTFHNLCSSSAGGADFIRLSNQLAGISTKNFNVYIIHNSREDINKLFVGNWISPIIFSIESLIVLLKLKNVDIIQTADMLCIPQLYIYKKLTGYKPIIFDLLGIRTLELKEVGIRNLKDLVRYIIYLILYMFLFKCVDVFVTINEQHMKLLKAKSNKPIYIIRDPVDITKFNNIPMDKMLFKKNNGDVLLTFIGTISNRRLDSLYLILPQLFEKAMNLKLLIIGSGPNLHEYINRANDMGLLNKHVYFTGFVSHDLIPDYLAISDITYSDIWSKNGFPMKVYEYMAAGKAIIIDDTESSREVLINGFNAILVNGPDDLLASIVLLSRNKILREDLGQKAKDKSKDYSLDKFLDKFRDLYLSIENSERLI